MGVPRIHEHSPRWLASFVTSGALLAPISAAAGGQTVSLTWQAPASCPDQAAVLGRVRSLLAASTEPMAAVTARSAVHAPAPGGHWELTLETVQGERTWKRTIQARSCDELADAAALIIALVVDPNLNAAPAAPAATPAKSAPAVPPISATPPTPAPGPAAQLPPAAATAPGLSRPAPSPVRRNDVAIHVAASALADIGTLPRPALGAEVAAGIGVTHARFEAAGTLLPPAREVIASGPARGGDITLLAAGVRGCYVLDSPPLSESVCAGFEAGRLSGTGFGASAFNSTEHELWIAGRLGVFAGYSLLDPLEMRFGVEGLVPVTRPEFFLDNVGPVHQPSPASLRLELGLQALFR